MSPAGTPAGRSVSPEGRWAGVGVARLPVEGPEGKVERLRLSDADPPEAVEQCLRALFGIGPEMGLVLRDCKGRALPIGPGLLLAAPEEAATGPQLRLEALGRPKIAQPATVSPKVGLAGRSSSPPPRAPSQNEPPSCPPSAKSTTSATMTAEHLALPLVKVVPSAANQEWNAKPAVEAECHFWCSLAASAGVRSHLLETCEKPSASLAGKLNRSSTMVTIAPDSFWDLVPFDTNPQRIDNLFDAWSTRVPVAGKAGANDLLDRQLSKAALRERLSRDCGINLSDVDLEEALRHVCRRFAGGSGAEESSPTVPRVVFASLWQRLILGAVCRGLVDLEDSASELGPRAQPRHTRVVEYNDTVLHSRFVSELELLFGGRERNVSSLDAHTTRWAIIENAPPETLLRLAVKFFLHPMATDDILDAAREGITKIDRYRHQYFVSLEVYSLSPEGADPKDAKKEPPRVNTHIRRSTMFLVATGNPPTRTRSSSRDWLLSILDMEHMHKADPLNRFSSDPGAAMKLIDDVRAELRAHGRVRENEADFLLFAIIDRAASEMTAIYNAYGRRLRFLQECLNKNQQSTRFAYADEASKVRLELQELRQWVGQLKLIMNHLETDCNGDAGTDGTFGSGKESVPWNFGAHSRGDGRSMLLFIRRTQDSLDQTVDRLQMLDDFAKQFGEEFAKHQGAFQTKTVFLLTCATAVFLPGQFVTGIFGMNFQDESGTPTIPELNWQRGYLYFWCVVGILISCGLIIMGCWLCNRGQVPTCRRCGCRRRRDRHIAELQMDKSFWAS